jgi:hypothetical protein
VTQHPSSGAGRVVGRISGPRAPAIHAFELTPAEIEARFRWARHQGHIAYLWPDVPVDAWRACLREIEHVTRLVLSTDRAAIEFQSPPGADTRATGIAAFTSGMGPLLGYWIDSGRIAAPADLAALLMLHLEHARRRAERMQRALIGTLDRLAAHDVEVVIIKSAHTARIYFPEPGVRPAADLDLVVAPRNVPVAVRVLEDEGYVRLKAQRKPYKSDWAPPDSPRTLRSLELTHADNPFTVELHDSIDRDFFGVRTFRLGQLGPANTTPAPEIHPAARVLLQPVLALSLAAHASEELHQLQLVRIVELVEVIRRDIGEGRTDWRELMATLRWTGGLRFVYPAFELAEQLAPGTVDEAARSELSAAATPRMRRVLERMGPGTAQRLEGLSLDERFLWTRGPAEILRRLAHMLWPTRGESRPLSNVYGERFNRLMRGRVSLRRKPK